MTRDIKDDLLHRTHDKWLILYWLMLSTRDLNLVADDGAQVAFRYLAACEDPGGCVGL